MVKKNSQITVGIIAGALLIVALYFFVRARGPVEVDSGYRLIMGTFARVTAVAPDSHIAKKCIEAAFEQLGSIEALMSYTKDDSQISRINRNAYKGPVRVDKTVFEVLQRAVEFSRLSKGAFDITANARIAVTADWDVGRAIVVTGSGKYILHPVVQLFVTELSGEIKGTVVDVADYNTTTDSLVVYAYEDGSYTDDEKNIVDEVRFLNAVSSSDVNMTDGNFTFSFLGEGNYTLMTAQYEGDIFIDVVDREDNVEVLQGETALVDLNTSD